MTEINIHELIDEAIEKKDRYINVFCRDTDVSVSVYPLGEDEAAVENEALIDGLKAKVARLTRENTQLKAQLKLLTDRPSDNGY